MKRYAFVIMALWCAGCVPGVAVSRIGAKPARTVASANVDVYRRTADVARRFRPIAELTADDKGWDYNYSILEDMIVTKAKKLGAQGVIFHDPEEEGASGYHLRGVLVVPKPDKTTMKATAIVYLP